MININVPISDNSGDCVMLVCRVLIGQFVVTRVRNKVAVHPPCTQCFKTRSKCVKSTFDSVIYQADNGLFTEYVVYSPTLILPQFVVTYKRTTKTLQASTK